MLGASTSSTAPGREYRAATVQLYHVAWYSLRAMHILTTTGELADVSQRQWPMAGLDMTRPSVQQSNLLKMVGDHSYASHAKLYRENPWLNAGIRTIAWGLSRSPLRVYELLADGQRRACRYDVPQRGPDNAGRRLDKELNAPVNGIGPQRRMRATVTDYLIYGNALWDTAEPEGTYHIPWHRVEVIEGDRVPILGYKIKGSKKDRFLAPEDVIHFNAADDPESILGLSPIGSLKYTLALHEALQRHLVKFFENMARPSGNLRLQPGASEKAIEAVSAQVRELYASPENAGKVMVTTGEFQSVTAGHDQSQIIELAKMSREEIAGSLRIPGPVLGFLDHAIKSNVKELREQYIRDVIGNWAPAMEDDIMAQRVRVDTSLTRFFVEFDLDVHLRPDMESLADVAAKTGGVVTTNERRRWFNLPDLEFPEADTVAQMPGGSYLGIADPSLDDNASKLGGGSEDKADKPQAGSTDPQKNGKTRVPKKPRDGDLDGNVNEPGFDMGRTPTPRSREAD
jgi:HK97 family phage portal protein